MKRTIFFLIIACAIGCDQADESFTSESNPESEILGTWKLYEEGYSPGSGYVVKPVSEVPSRTIVLFGEKQFSSTLQGLFDYKYYRVTKNTTNEVLELWLYKSEPDPLKDPEPSRKMYHFEFEGGILKLYPAFPSICIEGCHMGFKR